MVLSISLYFYIVVANRIALMDSGAVTLLRLAVGKYPNNFGVIEGAFQMLADLASVSMFSSLIVYYF